MQPFPAKHTWNNSGMTSGGCTSAPLLLDTCGIDSACTQLAAMATGTRLTISNTYGCVSIAPSNKQAGQRCNGYRQCPGVRQNKPRKSPHEPEGKNQQPYWHVKQSTKKAP